MCQFVSPLLWFGGLRSVPPRQSQGALWVTLALVARPQHVRLLRVCNSWLCNVRGAVIMLQDEGSASSVGPASPEQPF